MAQARARLFLRGIALVLVADRSPFSAPAALAALVSTTLSACGGLIEYHIVRHPHLLGSCAVSILFGGAAVIRDNRTLRPELCGGHHVGARLACLSNSSCADSN